ncbi:PPE domain-containing protein [Actinosynnema sp. NPDC050436]|uniref:PPE family protein n=1 Tax=Actinosynnema sp. NPDC050436 TaxID=3155659 RepID=UPI0033F2AF10
MGIGEHNFDAQSHRALYDKIHAGPGHSAARTVDDAWNSFRAVMGNAKSNLESAIRDARAVWIGAAGEQFSASSAPLVTWAEDLRTAGVKTHDAFSAQTSYYGGAKTAMPEPVQVTSTANDDYWGIPAGFQHLVGGLTDQDVQESAANEAKRQAVRVMNGYRDDAASAVDALGEFVPPPQVATRVAEPTFAQPEAHDQYAPRFSDLGSTDTSSASQRQSAQPQITAPPTFSSGDDVHTSVAQPPSEVAPRPTPSPTPPLPTPGPTPPGEPPAYRPLPGPPGRREQQVVRPNPPRPPADAPRYTRDRRPPGSTPHIPPAGGSHTGGTPRFGGGAPTPPGQPLGPGHSSGVAPDTQSPRAGTAGGHVRAAAGVSPVAGGVAGAPQRGRGEDDIEHETAPYLEELADVWGEESLPNVAPPVIGDDHR